MPTYYVDASVPVHVAQALALVRDDILYPGALGCPVMSPNVKDEVWLGIAGQQNWVVLMRDKAVRRRKWERQAIIDSGVKAFCMTTAGNYSKWRTLQLLAKRWDDIEDVAARIPGPFIYSVTQAGVRFLAS